MKVERRLGRSNTPPQILLDPTKVIDLLTKQTPHWEFGVHGHSYHALTYGYLTNELIRRVDRGKHRSMGKFIEEEIAPHIGDFECYFANYFSEQNLHRLSPCILPAKIESVGNQSESRYTT